RERCGRLSRTAVHEPISGFQGVSRIATYFIELVTDNAIPIGVIALIAILCYNLSQVRAASLCVPLPYFKSIAEFPSTAAHFLINVAFITYPKVVTHPCLG